MATITEDYCSKEIYRLLIEKGFDGEIHTTFDGEGYTQPSITLQMAMKWLRKKHLLHISIDMVNGGRWEYEIDDISSPFDGGVIPKYYCDKSFSSYEEAADDAIRYSLEHLIK